MYDAPFYCLRCGQNLRGVTGPSCPECGASANPYHFRARLALMSPYSKRAFAVLLLIPSLLLGAVEVLLIYVLNASPHSSAALAVAAGHFAVALALTAWWDQRVLRRWAVVRAVRRGADHLYHGRDQYLAAWTIGFLLMQLVLSPILGTCLVAAPVDLVRYVMHW